MAKTDTIDLANLLIDTNNPRLEESQRNQNDAIRAIAVNQNRKLVVLARDIVENGLNPSEFLLVMPFEENLDRYVVLEGNRRIAALKILENPDIISGAVEKPILDRFKKLGTQYQSAPIETLNCVIVDSRPEANHWIELRHTGENEGAGIVRWGGAETARFRRRSGQQAPHLQVLDFLEQRGFIGTDTRNKVPVTSLKRLLSNPYVRTKLGIDLKGGNIVTRFDEGEVAKGLKRIIDDLASGDIRTKDIYTKEDRIRYIDNLSPDDMPDTSKPDAEFRTLGSPLPSQQQIATSTPEVRKRSAPSVKQRSTLIPVRGFALRIDQTRINEIYHELRKLDVEEFTNAVSVLFRVFLELSLDNYSERNQLGTSIDSRLNRKLNDVANHLQNQGILNEQQLKPVRRAAQSDSFLGSTITTMHQYIHNQYFSPSPGDLRATWDSLQPFIEAMWS